MTENSQIFLYETSIKSVVAAAALKDISQALATAWSPNSLSSLPAPPQTTLPLPQGSSSSSPFSLSPPLSSFSFTLSSVETSSTLLSTVPEPTGTFLPTSNTKPESRITKTKIAVGVAVPIAVISVIIFGLWAWRKSSRRDRSTIPEGHPTNPPKEEQPHLQEIAELEYETRRRHELEAQEKRYEIDGNEIYELRGRHGRQEAI